MKILTANFGSCQGDGIKQWLLLRKFFILPSIITLISKSSKKLIKLIFLAIASTHMQMPNGPQDNVKPPECSFCNTPSEDIRTLLRFALHRMRKLLIQKKYSHVLDGQDISDSPNGINRLIRVIFERHQFELKYSRSCSHSRMTHLFRDKLKCRSDQLELVIDELCDKIGRRNYELELISLQVKNVENSVLQLQDSLQISTKSRKPSQSISSQEPLPPTSHLVKVEQEHRPQRDAEIDVGVVGNYAPSFEGFPFSYNIIYYGTSYFQ